MKTFTNKHNETYTVKVGDFISFKLDIEGFGRIKSLHDTYCIVESEGKTITAPYTHCWVDDF